jgi:hypothetical protein
VENCRICEVRRPRRYCPGVRGDICSLCCGTEREATVDCPFECEYLQEARRRERPPEVDPKTIPNQDVQVTEQFLSKQDELLAHCGRTLLNAALESAAIDFDVREALESMIKTYRTLESGLIYETRPSNPLAAHVQQRMQEGIASYRQEHAQRTGMSTVRDADVLGVLVFLQRLELHYNNQRRKGKAFLDHLRSFFPTEPAPARQSLLA